MNVAPTLTSRGFTLVEVLVALAIVAITLGAGLRVSGAQINLAQRQQQILLAQLCVENELIQVRLSGQLPNLGEKSFECDQAGVIQAGMLYVQPTPNPSFRKVDAVVGTLKLSTIVGRF